MSHEWKISDWCELNGRRYFVYRTMVDRCWAVPHDGSGQDIMFDRGDEDVKHLPDCTGWDWEAPKPQPSCRPMTRDEFFDAWKLRLFCPLVNQYGDIISVEKLNSSDDDLSPVFIGGWIKLENLMEWKFASDNSLIRMEAN